MLKVEVKVGGLCFVHAGLLIDSAHYKRDVHMEIQLSRGNATAVAMLTSVITFFINTFMINRIRTKTGYSEED